MESQDWRPRLTVCNSTSVDARVAISPDLPLMVDRRWPENEAYAMALATGANVILEGSGSFVPDSQPSSGFDPAGSSENGLRTDFLPAEIMARARGWFVVIDSRGRVRWQFKEFPDSDFAGWHLLVAVAATTPPAYLAFLRREGIPYLVVGDDRVDLRRLLRGLRDRLGTEKVAATGGGHLGGALLRAGLVDEVHLELVPIAIGGTRTPQLFAGPDLAPSDQPVQLRLLCVERGESDRLRIRYAVARD